MNRRALERELDNEEREQFLFRWSFICLMVGAVIATISILNVSWLGGVGSLIWLGLAAFFAKARQAIMANENEAGSH